MRHLNSCCLLCHHCGLDAHTVSQNQPFPLQLVWRSNKGVANTDDYEHEKINLKEENNLTQKICTSLTYGALFPKMNEAKGLKRWLSG